MARHPSRVAHRLPRAARRDKAIRWRLFTQAPRSPGGLGAGAAALTGTRLGRTNSWYHGKRSLIRGNSRLLLHSFRADTPLASSGSLPYPGINKAPACRRLRSERVRSHAGLDLAGRTDHELVQNASHLAGVGRDPCCLEVADDLPNDIIISDFLKISHHHRISIGFGICP